MIIQQPHLCCYHWGQRTGPLQAQLLETVRFHTKSEQEDHVLNEGLRHFQGDAIVLKVNGKMNRHRIKKLT